MKPTSEKISKKFGCTTQRGLVLFIALIALVVLSLAAVALIRSVDTATLVAGNLSFKQSATNSAENSLITANAWIAAQSLATPTNLEVDNPAMGYYATTGSLATVNGYAGMTSYQMLTNDTTWAANKSRLVQLGCNGLMMADNTDCAGNQVRYVIERMCTLPGAASGATTPAGQQTLFGPETESPSTMGIQDAPHVPNAASSGQPMYRVTARSVGPKNSVSFIQAFVY